MATHDTAVYSSGTILDDRYRVLGQLGRGGMGHVYDAVHLALDQRVAVKVLHPQLAEDERFRARFLQEARAASRIRHPNVVEIKDFGNTPDGSVYFVMEYLRGHDLSVELRQRGTLPWARVRHILLQAASALQAAHAKKIIHRDIKPGNCFLLADEDADHVDAIKLVDFGIAKVCDSGKALTGNDEIIGTASYMSPEQARSEPLDARSDIYSLGVMAYKMLTGLVPFRGSDAFRVIAAHLEQQPEPVRRLAPEVSPAVDAMVLKMLAKAPADRYASMEAVVQALRAIPQTARRRSIGAWVITRDLYSSAPQNDGLEPTQPSRSVARDAPAAPTGTSNEDEGTTVVRTPASPSRRQVGEQPAIEATSSTESLRATDDTIETGLRTRKAAGSSRRLAGLALVGLLGLLAGGTVLVTKALLASDGARVNVESYGRPPR